MEQCCYCGRECKNSNSHKNHERRCPKNVNRIYKNGMTGKKGSNHYIKAKELELPPPVISIETRKKISNRIRERSAEFNKKNGEKISLTVQKKVELGEWHTSLAKKMHISYKGVDLHGTWEVEYAKYLDLKGIKWFRNSKRFEYLFDGKKRFYTPDFYLSETDEYVEIKGYKIKKDSEKWNQFPNDKTLIILMKDDLLNLGVNIKV